MLSRVKVDFDEPQFFDNFWGVTEATFVDSILIVECTVFEISLKVLLLYEKAMRIVVYAHLFSRSEKTICIILCDFR